MVTGQAILREQVRVVPRRDAVKGNRRCILGSSVAISIAEGFPFGKDPTVVKTIGNYWPYATTVFDYVRRAMPQMTPGSLTNDRCTR